MKKLTTVVFMRMKMKERSQRMIVMALPVIDMHAATIGSESRSSNRCDDLIANVEDGVEVKMLKL